MSTLLNGAPFTTGSAAGSGAMSIDREKLDSFLSPTDRRHVCELLGIHFNGHSENRDGWVNGLRLPPAVHQDTNPSLSVNLQTGAVYDHGGHFDGSLYQLVQAVRGCTFPEALQWVAEQTGYTGGKPKRSKPPKADPPPKPAAKANEVQSWNQHLLEGTDTPATVAREYLTERRGLSLDTLKRFRIGLRRYGNRQHSGWWIVIPLQSTPSGDAAKLKLFAFDVEIGRWCLRRNGKKIVSTWGGGVVLYPSLKALRRPTADAGASGTDGRVLLCEGETDVLTALQYGYPAITGTGGAKKFSDEWAAGIAEVAAEVVICYDGDDTGRDGAASSAATLYTAGLSVYIADMPDGEDVNDVLLKGGPEEFDRILKNARRYEPGNSSIGVLVSEVEREQVRWLWPGRLALGKLTIFDGDPGLGKSTMLCDVAGRLTSGKPLPETEGLPTEPGGVVFITTEDGIADTIRPRLEAAGADLSRCLVVPVIPHDDGPGRLPTIPRDLPKLAQAVRRVNACLVVIDPLMAHLGDINSHSDQDVRLALSPLAEWAERCKVAVAVVRHLNKMSGGNPLYRGGGSIGIIGQARMGFVVGRDPKQEDRLVLAPTKNNLASQPPPLAFRLKPWDSDPNVARVEWGGISGGITAADLLRSPDGRGRPPEEREEAEDFLRRELSDGPRKARDMYEQAEAEGIEKRTLKRAKKELGVESYQPQGFGMPWYWRLPSDGDDSPGPPLSNSGTLGKTAEFPQSAKNNEIPSGTLEDDEPQPENGTMTNGVRRLPGGGIEL